MTWIKSAYLKALNFFQNFKDYTWDMIGIAMIALALILGLGFLDLTSGSIVTPLVSVIAKWLGWGSILLLIGLMVLGVMSMRVPNGKSPHFRLVKVLQLEGVFFTTLMVLTLLGGISVDRAEAGKDGGMIGWGLVRLLSDLITPVGTILVLIPLFLASILYGFGLERRVYKKLGWHYKESAEIGSGAVSIIDPAQDLTVKPVSRGSAGIPPDQTAPKPSSRQGGRAAVPAKATTDLNTGGKPGQSAARSGDLPPLNILLGDASSRTDERHINQTAGLIEKTLAEFGVPAKVVGYRTGPTVTQFAVEPGFIERPGTNGEGAAQKVRVAQISALSRDLALALSARQLRIEAPVPGRSYVGIEVPNNRSAQVRLRSILDSEVFRKTKSPLAIALGRDVSGQPVVADLSKMPHLLIAGTTGSGKSVCIAALTTCLVMNNSPHDLRLIMIDPKRVELVRFNELPHLYR